MKLKILKTVVVVFLLQIVGGSVQGQTFKELTQQANEAFTNQDYALAVKSYSELIRLNPKFEQAYAARGDAYLLLGKSDEAIKDLNEAIRLNPTNYVAYELRGTIHYENQKFDQAISDFNSALEAKPDDRPAFKKLRGDAFALRGKSYYWKNSYDKAIDDFTQALKLQSAISEILQKRGVSYYHLNETNKALIDFNDALLLDPKDELSLSGRGLIYLGTGSFLNALQDFEQVIKLKPKASSAYNHSAWILATCPDDKLRDGKKAVELATKACELSKWKKYAFVETLAAAYAEAGNFEQAVKYQKQASNMAGISEDDRTNFQNRVELYLQHKPYREVR